MEEMPPRRMGSISVVVVFSSRLSFFSGGPEPPSPAARLLPGPDMAAAGRSGAGSPEARQAGGGDASVTCRTQRAEMWKRPELLRPRASSAPTCWPPPRRLRAPHQQQNHPIAAILDSPGRHWPPQHRAQAPQAVPDVAKSSPLPVSIGRPLCRLSGPVWFLPEHRLFLSVIGQ